MGIQGSGTWCRWNTRTTTESQHKVDIRWLRKQHYLYPGASGHLSWSSRGEKTGSIRFRIKNDSMILTYRHRQHDGDWDDVEQIVSIDRTSCNYGGHRKWFLCPNCGKRVAILYGAGKYFLCRHCHGLTYDSCNASPIQRIYDKAIKLRKKIGGNGVLVDPIPIRPKGMHRSVYKKIVAEIYRLQDMGDAGVFEKYGIRL